MNFRISDTFTISLARLTNDEQKAVKTTAFDLQINPANPGMSFHKLDNARDKNFWSVRVSADLRLIVHRTPGSLLLCYVDHHDKAYAWAERRKLETHPKTGAAQLVEIRETVQDVVIPNYIEAPPTPKVASHPFANISDDELLTYGVPTDWIASVRNATDETILGIAEHLPGEAAEAVLELATGGTPRIIAPTEPIDTPFDHPDARRRFRVMTNVVELERALEFPWDRWTVFLHPEQEHLVERDFGGPARVSGSAGTGKTIVALHRAVFLARTNPDARVLLTTFSDTLANDLSTRLRRLVSNEPHLADRIDVHSISTIGSRLYKMLQGKAHLASQEVVSELLKTASKEVGDHKFSLKFLLTEWEQVVDAWQLGNWEAYRDVMRLGRKTRLSEQQRILLWSIFGRVQTALISKNLVTQAGMFSWLATVVAASKNPLFEFAIVDESQDIGIAHVRFFAAIGGNRPNALFFAGDLGQRIFQQPFSWKALGVDVRGKSKTLRVNYRTSHQIRMQADRLLGPEVSDTDGNIEERSNTVSVFNGLVPEIPVMNTEVDEINMVAEWVSKSMKSGMAPHEIGIFVRSQTQVERALKAVVKAGVAFKVLDEHVNTASGYVSISTMHLAKGLEFRAVAVMACDDEVIPLQERIEAVSDDADLQEVYDTERQLLYVACTRARDRLLVCGVEPVSEFLDDLKG